MKKHLAYIATPMDRTPHERRVEASRVEFDGLPPIVRRLPNGKKILVKREDRTFEKLARVSRYGK